MNAALLFGRSFSGTLGLTPWIDSQMPAAVPPPVAATPSDAREVELASLSSTHLGVCDPVKIAPAVEAKRRLRAMQKGETDADPADVKEFLSRDLKPVLLG